MNNNYFAVAGHDRLLTEAELSVNNTILTKLKFINKYIYVVEKPLNSDIMGSVAFSGTVIYKDSFEGVYEEFVKLISKKKVNIYFNVETRFDAKHIKANSKAKNLNIKKNAFPNFGNLKSAQNFIITKAGKLFCLLEVDDYADQSIYKFVDEKLPHSDLKKGIINLKLAKTLLNFTTQRTIVDPFAGFGRIAFSDYKKVNKYYMTDIDDVCQRYMRENNEFMNSKFDGENRIEIVKTSNFIDLSSKLDSTVSEESFSIVTEGTLGKNFGKKVPLNIVVNEQNKVINLWLDCIKNLIKSEKIHDLVFCLPFTNEYGKTKSNVLNFIEQVEKKHPSISFYEFEKGKKVIFYSRGSSFIGHGVLKLVFR